MSIGAAALRDLEQWRNRAATDRNWSRGEQVDLLGRIIDELAAVLTQEGANEPAFTASMYGTADAADKARDEWRAAPAEPRAAEGAGTGTVAYIVKFDDAEREDVLFSGEYAERAALDYFDQSQVNWSCYLFRCIAGPKPRENSTVFKPTAAAAVPAGGDAVAWLVTTTSGGVGAYVYRENIPMETAKFIEPLYTAPAPRGGVTEARKPDGYAYRYETYDCQVIRLNGGIEVNGGKPIEAIPYYFGTPTAAQAQDAGPKAEHWISALCHYGIPQYGAERIAQSAYDRAAKEAK